MCENFVSIGKIFNQRPYSETYISNRGKHRFWFSTSHLFSALFSKSRRSSNKKPEAFSASKTRKLEFASSESFSTWPLSEAWWWGSMQVTDVFKNCHPISRPSAFWPPLHFLENVSVRQQKENANSCQNLCKGGARFLGVVRYADIYREILYDRNRAKLTLIRFWTQCTAKSVLLRLRLKTALSNPLAIYFRNWNQTWIENLDSQLERWFSCLLQTIGE